MSAESAKEGCEYSKEVEVLGSPNGEAVCIDCARDEDVQSEFGIPDETEWGPGTWNRIALVSPITCESCGETCYYPL